MEENTMHIPQKTELAGVFSKHREILGMDSSPLRFDWRRGLCELWSETYKRRRNMLAAAHLHASAQYREWHELSPSLRMEMDKVLNT